MVEPLSTLAMAVASKAATTALEPYIQQLLEIQDTQNQALERLEDNVRAMMEAPWREARLHLIAAESAGPRDLGRRDAELDKTADALVRAYSVHAQPSVARALVAADAATLDAMVGRPEGARQWAARAHDDIVSFLRVEAARVQSELNRRPAWVVRMRRQALEDRDLWDYVLGGEAGKGDVPAPAPANYDAKSASSKEWDAEEARKMRSMLELGPDAPPGWQLDHEVPMGGAWRTRTPDGYPDWLWFRERDVPIVNAIAELHRGSARAEGSFASRPRVRLSQPSHEPTPGAPPQPAQRCGRLRTWSSDNRTPSPPAVAIGGGAVISARCGCLGKDRLSAWSGSARTSAWSGASPRASPRLFPHQSPTEQHQVAGDSRKGINNRRLTCGFYVVEPRGLEPVTPCLQSRCATNCAKAPCGDEVQLRLTASVASAQRACSALPSSSFFLA